MSSFKKFSFVVLATALFLFLALSASAASFSNALSGKGLTSIKLYYSISPSNYSAEVGETVEYKVFLNDEEITDQFYWSVSAPSGAAALQAPAKVQAKTPGQAIVRAFNDSLNVSLEANLSVSYGNVSRVEVSPATLSVKGCTNTQLNASAFNSHGALIPAPINWSTSNSSIAEIISSNDSAATVRGKLAGSATVRAANPASGAFAEAQVKVVPGDYAALEVVAPQEARAGTQVKLSAFLRDACGNPALILPGSIVNWSSTPNANISSDGNFSAQATKNYSLKGEYKGFTGSKSIKIVLGQLKTITVTDSEGESYFNASVDSPKQLVVEAQDVYGNKQTPFDDFWGTELSENAVISTQSAGGSGRIDDSLNFYGQKNGLVKIVVEAEGLSAQATANVVGHGAAAAIELSAPKTVVTTGEGIQINASVKDAYGNSVPAENSVKWSVYSGSGSINSTGYFVSTVPGDCQVRAAVGNTYSLITIRVGVGPAHHLIPSIDSLEASAGVYYKIRVKVVDAYDNEISLPNTQYNYFVQNITGTGETINDYFIGYQAGTVKIVVQDKTNANLSGEAQVTVVPGLPQLIEIRSDNGLYKLREGETLQLLVYVEDAYGNEIPQNRLLNPSWQVSSEGGQARIDSNGLLEAIAPGRVRVTFSLPYASKNASQQFNVIARQQTFSQSFPAGNYGAKPYSNSSTALITTGGEKHQPQATSAASAAASTASGFFTLAASNPASLVWLALLAIFLAAVFVFVRSRVYAKAGEEREPLDSQQDLRRYLLS
ncbi:MAG: hypothetical protein ACP5IG_04020 [Candidatus Micrarchaeia archaeon]